jgi:hypothetical protein
VFVPVYRSYYPWGFGGLGFGGYYGRYYDPYVFYDPYAPWYGGYGYGYPGTYAPFEAGGKLRLKVRASFSGWSSTPVRTASSCGRRDTSRSPSTC